LAAKPGLTSNEQQQVKAVGVGGTIAAAFSTRPIALQISDHGKDGILPVILDIFGPEIFANDCEVVGLIGNDVLQTANLTIDYPNARLWIE
jgi:hypothetical protein